MRFILILLSSFFLFPFLKAQNDEANSKTVALWLFDEQEGVYPSSVLNDASPNDYPLVLGQGGSIVSGKFGNALEPLNQAEVKYPEGEVRFGLEQILPDKGRKTAPMSWMNANFCALMTMGENHLRKDVGFVNPLKTKLNLGDFDWTVEFWFNPTERTDEDGVVFELGEGPRGENDIITSLTLNSNLKGFTFFNEPSGTKIIIPSDEEALNPKKNKWHHFAFVYSSKVKKLYHYVDGVLQKEPVKFKFESLKPGSESYMSVGRDGEWKKPLQGKLDEIRFSEGMVYQNNFTPPQSFSEFYNGNYKQAKLQKTLPLLFEKGNENQTPLKLGTRKYLFIDGAIADKMKNINFVVNPPKDDKNGF